MIKVFTNNIVSAGLSIANHDATISGRTVHFAGRVVRFSISLISSVGDKVGVSDEDGGVSGIPFDLLMHSTTSSFVSNLGFSFQEPSRFIFSFLNFSTIARATGQFVKNLDIRSVFPSTVIFSPH